MNIEAQAGTGFTASFVLLELYAKRLAAGLQRHSLCALEQHGLCNLGADAFHDHVPIPIGNIEQYLNFRKEMTTMENTTNPFFGKTVVATGKLTNYTRDGIQTRLLQLGAKPASSVSKATDYLIVGEKAGSKLAKAQQLGIPTLTEQQFESMLA